MHLSMGGRIAVAVALASVLAYLATPAAILAARRFAFYDRPFGHKVHGSPTPYLGGAAVMAAFALTFLIGGGHSARTLPLLGGVVVLWTVGTVDDRRTVSPLLRVGIEIAVGALLSFDGLGWHLGAGGFVDAATTGIWVVAVVNAFNLFDNMDGQAGTMGLVVAAGVCLLAITTGNVWVAAGSAALCGACLGFLPHNLASPAKIFLGDGGSMPLGLAAAVLVASAAQRAEPSLLALLAGFMLVGVPVLDTCLVMVSRRRRGVSILTGGQDHLTHRTRTRMRTAGRVALVLGSGQALVSGLVIAGSQEGSSTLVYIVLASIVCAGAVIGALESVSASQPILLTNPGSLAAGENVATTELQTPAAAPAPSRHRRLTTDALRPTVLLVLGLGAGISPLFNAYYDLGVWVPIGLVLVIAAAAGMIGWPPHLGRAAILALIGTAGLGLFSLLSGTWASASEQATVSGDLWLSYAAFLMILFVLLRRRRDGLPLLIGVGVGILVVGLSVLMRMLGSDPMSLFLGGRLNAPLGYINGEGCVFAMGCWLGLAMTERRNPWLAGPGAALTVMMACLALLSESRGAAIATFVAALAALILVPGLRRRVFALAVVALGIAVAASSVVHIYSAAGRGTLSASTVRSAASSILIGGALAGVVWGAIVLAADRLSARGGARRLLLGRIATAGAVVLLTIPLLGGLVRIGSLERTAKSQWHAFIHLSGQTASSSATQTRLFSGAGNRYDYWRVAWHVFTRNPVAGVAAGNYTAAYFRERRTQEAIQNPHSLELQTLSELGLIGGILLVVLVVGAALGFKRWRAAARASTDARTMAVAALGVCLAWFVDTSGDWMHLLPGVTAAALAGVAVMCCEDTSVPSPAKPPAAGGWSRRHMPRRPAATFAGAAAVAFVLAIAGASLLRAGVTQVYLDRAHSELGRQPGRALVDAGRVLTLDGANLDAYYVKAAALARFDRAAAARSTLLAATREDPTNFVTWVLLGDLEVRLRNFSAAQAFYLHAHRLTPSDVGIAALAANPASALSASPAS